MNYLPRQTQDKWKEPRKTMAFPQAEAVYGTPGMGQGPGSDTAAKFYGAVLDQRVFWEHTFAHDGVMEFSLPAGNKTINGTDGQSLAKLVLHSVVRDMIIRADTWFPKYPLRPTCPFSTQSFVSEFGPLQLLLVSID